MTKPAAEKRKRYPKGPAKPGEIRAPTGRPLLYTELLWAEIMERLSAGEPLQQICRDDHMPCVNVVYDWSDPERRPNGVPATLVADFARARQRGHDAIAAECLQIANTPVEGVETTTRADGSVEAKRGDMLGHRKLQIETRLQLLAKWDKRYGSKVEHTGANGGPIVLIASTIDEKL